MMPAFHVVGTVAENSIFFLCALGGAFEANKIFTSMLGV